MVATKKIMLFIVEGETDEATFNPILKKIFSDSTLRFHIVRGDITAHPFTNSKNAVSKINDCIKAEQNKYGFMPSDVVKIVHIIDTDGAFIPKEKVVFEETGHIIYEDESIKTQDIEYILQRNTRKKEVVLRLISTGAVRSIPYEIFFMSRNLEHVLHNIDNQLSDEEKIELADCFAETYEDDIEGFKTFVSKSDFAVEGNFNETWDFIFKGTNSLKRYSNIHLMLKDNPRGK